MPLAIPLTAATQAPHGVAALVTAVDPGLAAHPMGTLLAVGLLALGFTRMTPRDAVENPVRRGVLDALAAGRWCGASDLARALGVSRKTVAYHLRILERAGLAVRHGPPARPLFAGPGHARSPHATTRLLEHANRRAVWEAAKAAPGASVPELARAAGMKPGTAYFHAKVLAEAGLLEPVEYDGARGYVAALPLDAQPPPRPAPA